MPHDNIGNPSPELLRALKAIETIPVPSFNASQRVAVSSSAWVDALRESKERIYRSRSDYYTTTGKNPPGYHEVMTALSEAMRLTESASTGEICGGSRERGDK